MRRLETFRLTIAVAALACASPASRSIVPTPTPSEDAAREQTADQQVRHVLDRLAFGPRPGDYERVRAMGVDKWIDEQLQPQKIDDRDMDALLAHFPTLTMSPAELMREYPLPAMIIRQKQLAARRSANRRGTGSTGASPALALSPTDSMEVRQVQRASQRVLTELQTAKMARAVASNRQLEEVMVDFWENHFNVFAGKGPERYYLAAYERDAIRPYALGHFRDLLEAVAKSPAMLYYLDNWESSADSGRPVLGARGSGLGVRELPRSSFRAHALSFRAPALSFRAPALSFRAPARNLGLPTRSLAPLGMTVPCPNPEPRAPHRGINENYGRELMELHTLGVNGGYTQQDVINVARAFTGWTLQAPRQGGVFVFRPRMHDAGTKTVLGHTLPAGRGMQDGEQVLDILSSSPATAHFISMELVRRFVSDSPPPALVHRAADTFTRTNGDIREVLRTIFYSPEFFSRAAYKAKVKSPFELVASALRAVGAEPDTTPRTARIVARLGEPLFMHRDPNGYPETGDAWINTGSILNRINFGLAVASGRLPGVSLARWEQNTNLANAPLAQQVDTVIADILGGEASPDTRKVLMEGENPLLGMRDSLSFRANARNLGQPAGDPSPKLGMTAPSRAPSPASRIPTLLGLALGAPEFQRR